ncbi:MAG: tetratricopeptide repeat protein [Candidatus Omnitrophota bacterium]
MKQYLDRAIQILRTKKGLHGWAFVLIALLSLCVYSNTFQSDFQFDDLSTIVGNPAIRGMPNVRQLWASFNTRFFTGFTFALNYAVGGLHVSGYHLINVLIHICSSVCVYIFVLLTFQTPALRDSSLKEKSYLISLFAALLFAVHPIQTQAVTYITQRAQSMAVLFYLLALNLYIKFRLTSRPVFHLAAFLVVLLGMFTKELMLTFPFVLLAYEFYFFNLAFEAWKKSLKLFVPFFLTLLIIPLCIMIDYHPTSVLTFRKQFITSSLNLSTFLTKIDVQRTFLRLLVWPVNQNLDYDYPLSTGFFSPSTFSAFCLLVALLICAVYLFRRQRIISFCILWFFLTTPVEFMAMAYFARDIMFEHHLYLPMVGFSLLISFGLTKILRNTKYIVLILGGLVLILSWAAYERNKVWADPITLWSDVTKKSPNKPRPYSNLGFAYARIGQFDQAIRNLQKSISVDPTYEEAYVNLCGQWGYLHEYDKAIVYCERAIHLDPFLTQGYRNLALAYASKRNLDQAIYYYYRALEADPSGEVEIFTNLANIYEKKGNLNKAIHAYLRVVELEPKNFAAYNNLALTFMKKGQPQEALKYANKAAQVNSLSAQANNTLGVILAQNGNIKEARLSFTRAVRLDPDNQDFRKNLESIQKFMEGRGEEP